MENNIWIDKMSDLNPEALWPTGFSEAIIGISQVAEAPPRFVMDTQKIIQLLIDDHERDREDAIEYYYFNIEGAHMGESQPIYSDPETWPTD